jgi:hypothetical protein
MGGKKFAEGRTTRSAKSLLKRNWLLNYKRKLVDTNIRSLFWYSSGSKNNLQVWK